jgi:hypothetical protein
MNAIQPFKVFACYHFAQIPGLFLTNLWTHRHKSLDLFKNLWPLEGVCILSQHNYDVEEHD